MLDDDIVEIPRLSLSHPAGEQLEWLEAVKRRQARKRQRAIQQGKRPGSERYAP